MRRSEGQTAKRVEKGNHDDAANAAGDIFNTYGAREAPIAVSRCREQRETEIAYRHQDQAEHHRSLHPHPRIENTADENADQIGPETETDVEDRNLVIAETKVVEQ